MGTMKFICGSALPARRVTGLAAALLLILSHSGAFAQKAYTPGDPIPASFFGINGVGYMHYRDARDAAKVANRKMSVVKQIGATWDRSDFWWSVLEPKPGAWDWSKGDWMIDYFARNKVNVFPILAYNAEWMKEHSPSSTQDFQQYGNYVYQVVSRYKDRVRHWEVWNEPNIPTFWKPQPQSRDYAQLLKTAYEQAHRADPGCVIVGGATSMTDVNFLTDVAKSGCIQYMDAVSFHPYTMADGPEEMDLPRQIENVRNVMEKHGRSGIPMWITEMGWTCDIKNSKDVDNQARYLVESYVIAAAMGIERLFWFGLQDWNENGHLQGWGLISPNFKPKRTVGAYRTMVSKLTGARFQGYLDLTSGTAYVFSRDKKGPLVVAWAHRWQKAELPLPAKAAATNVYGEKMKPKGRTLVVEDNTPVYVEFSAPAEFAGLSKSRPQPASILVNPSFEDSDTTIPYGWNMGFFYGGWDKGKFGVNEADPAAGKRAVTLSQTTEALWQSWPIPCVPGEQYTLRARMRTKDATGENFAQLYFLTGPGWGAGGNRKSSPITGTTNGWMQVEVSGVVPEGSDMLRINLSSANNSGTVEFDDLSLTRK